MAFLAQVRVSEVVHVHPGRVPGRAPLLPAILEEPDEFLLLRIHTDHRLAGCDVFGALAAQVGELGVTVLMRGAFDLFRVALQTESVLVEQVRDRPRRDPMAR